jgi:hypothetical protein
MVLINEWLSNPSGRDTDGEWVELFNGGQEKADLRDWSLGTGNGKRFTLTGYEINGGSYLLLRRGETKLTLRNSSETLSLYDSTGRLIDQSSFPGSAPEGKSLNREGETFVFADPTPGAPNGLRHAEQAENIAYPFREPLHSPLPSTAFLELLFGSSFFLALFVVMIIKRNEDISKLFFS